MRRRHIMTAITMVALCGLLALGLAVGVKTLFKPVPSLGLGPAAAPSPTCDAQKVDKGDRVRATQIEVSVFNAGSRLGLAGDTLDQLGNRGFRKGEIGNAPSGAKVKHLQVWTIEKHDAGARLVAMQFGPHVKVHVKSKSQDLGPGVDVIVGDGFRGLVHAPRFVKVSKPQELCVTDTPSARASG
jgi:hypothetical protein